MDSMIRDLVLKTIGKIVQIGMILIVCSAVTVGQDRMTTFEKGSMVYNGIPITQDASKSEALNKIISINLQDIPLLEAVEIIAVKANLKMVYNSKLLEKKNRSISTSLEQVTVEKALWAVLEGTGLRFAISADKQLVLLKREEAINSGQGALAAVQETITGTITDGQSGETLPGVNILVKGTSTGASTDANGTFELTVESLQDTLVVTYIGYQRQEIPINDRTEIDIQLTPEAIMGEEMVVVGYGTQEVGEVTGSISSVSSEDLEEVNVVNASSALKGAVSGVTAVESNTPGEGASIRIRGMTTINDNEPLWVVDGVPGASVNPENIESISVLKDAASQAIYGARASNGVVIVNTKSGSRNQPVQVNVKIRNGVTRNMNSYNMLNTQEYGELLWLRAANDGVTNYSHPQYGDGDQPSVPDYILPAGTYGEVDESQYDREMVHEDGDDTFIIMRANKEGTDWMDEIQRAALYQEYSIGLSGGSESTNYAFQVGYLKDEGVLKHTGYDRYNLRSNVTVNVTDWLRVGEKVGVTYSEDYGNQVNNSEATVISNAYRMQPIIPVYDIRQDFAGTRASGTGNGTNPVWNLYMNRHDRTNGFNLSGNTFVEASILENLSLRTLVGINYNTSDEKDYIYVQKAHAERNQYDELYEFADFGLQWNWTNTLEYTTSLAAHDITILGGTEAIQNNYRWRDASRQNFFSRDSNYMQLSSGSQNQLNNGNESQWNLFSIFGRINYEYDQTYLLEAVVRRDGSSRFGEENRFGTFPAFSAGWRITNESFMSAADNWLNNLIVRLGYGLTGNDRIGNYNAYTTYASNSIDSYYPISGGNTGAGTAGFYRSSLGNANVRWEVSTTANIGIDAILFENWNLSVDLWNRVTEDMLYPQQIPYVLGQADAPSINVGEMENTGIDVEVGYQGTAFGEDLLYGIDLNVSHYNNKVNRLSSEANEFIQGAQLREMYYTRAESGTQFPEFYGYVVDGIFQTQQEADNHPDAFDGYNEPGRFKYRDINGDGVIDSNDRTYIGDPHPDFTAGLNFNVQYNRFSVSTRFYTSYGNEMVNYVRRWIDFRQFQGGRSERRLYESWGSPYLDNNQNATMPKAEGNDTESQQPSTYFIEDASYLRMEQLYVSYDLGSLLNLQQIRNLQIYIQGNNLFTITNYSGLDPEVAASGINRGVDQGAWPTVRRLMFGVDIGL